MPTYVALLTLDENGELITDRPTSERIIATDTDYTTILRVCREHRVATYRNRKTGEERVVTEQQSTGCAWTDEPLFQWLGQADLDTLGSYAIPVDTDHLVLYQPKGATHA